MRYRYQSENSIYEIDLERTGESYRAAYQGQTFKLEILDSQPGELCLLFDGCPITLYWASDGNQKWVSMNGCTFRLEKPSSRSARRGSDTAQEKTLRAPMPAQVRSVQVSEGDAVVKGQTLLVLEAMKMEIRLQASQEGRIVHLSVQQGQTVERNQVLVELGD